MAARLDTDNALLPLATSVPGDYDHDGKTDFALWRPSTQTWYVILSSNPGSTRVLPLGATSPLTATPVSLTPFAAYPGVSLSTHKAPIYYTLSGNISSNGANLSGVLLSVTGSTSTPTTSDANGNYFFTIQAYGNIVITPALAGYTFSPPSFSWTALANDNVDGKFSFAATAPLPPVAPPHIDSLSLTQGPAQMGFLINGSNFGASQGGSKVTWGTGLMVLNWTDTQITVQVPVQTANQVGNVTVTVAGQTSNGTSFMVTDPFGCSN